MLLQSTHAVVLSRLLPPRFQRRIADRLKPIHVDPEDKSWKAFFTRARNAALVGVNHDIHDEIADDANLTEVCASGRLSGCYCSVGCA